MDIHNPQGLLRKQLRTLLETGLNRDYEKGLRIVKRIVQSWGSGALSARDAYMALFKELREQDRRIDRIYDFRGSQYFLITAILLTDGTLNENDIRELPEDAREWLLEMRDRFQKDMETGGRII